MKNQVDFYYKERDAKICEMQAAGKTYKAIAERFCLSRVRITQIVDRGRHRQFLEKHKDIFPRWKTSVSTRTANCIRYAFGRFVSDEQVVEEITNPSGVFNLRSPRKVRGYGSKCAVELCRLYDIDMTINNKRCPHCGKELK